MIKRVVASCGIYATAWQVQLVSPTTGLWIAVLKDNNIIWIDLLQQQSQLDSVDMTKIIMFQFQG